MASPEPHNQVADRLTELGFSVYEARTYIGLLQRGPATGYTISNATGVPGPKVYETLRRLVERGAAVQTGERPARYGAVPAERLLAALERTFQARLQAARRDLEQLRRPETAEQSVVLARLQSASGVVARALQAVEQAQRRVYLSARGPELAELSDAVAAASARGVEFVVVHFGRLPFPEPLGRTFPHGSTRGSLYPARGARHLILVSDSRTALWAVARDGKTWEGLYGPDPLFASAVKAYIRHDVYVQRMYADAPEELERRYGPGLLQLNDLSPLPERAETDQREAAG